MKTKTKKPSKQRKRLYTAPHHQRSDFLSAHLSSELKGSHNRRSIPVRTGDTVRVLRGDYEGYEGKILRVDREGYRVFVEGINREKADGSSVLVPIDPSKVEVVRLNTDDKWRRKVLERKVTVEEIETPAGETSEKKEEAKVLEEPSEKTANVGGER